jgi:hypothetical protein
MHPDMAGEVWSVVKHLADKTGVESSAGYNGQLGIDTHIPLMGQRLGVGGDNPVYPHKMLVWNQNSECSCGIQEVNKFS